MMATYFHSTPLPSNPLRLSDPMPQLPARVEAGAPRWSRYMPCPHSTASRVFSTVHGLAMPRDAESRVKLLRFLHLRCFRHPGNPVSTASRPSTLPTALLPGLRLLCGSTVQLISIGAAEVPPRASHLITSRLDGRERWSPRQPVNTCSEW